MKRIVVLFLALAMLLTLTVGTVSAAPGGMPAAHGVNGRAFGGAVSGLAQTNPLDLAAHVYGK